MSSGPASRRARLALDAATPAELWLLRLDPHPDDERRALLHGPDRDRLDRSTEPHRGRFLARRALLADVVADVLGVDPAELALVDVGGRVVVRHPRHGDVEVSTSSSGGVGLVAVGGPAVGVDIEATRLVPEADDIARTLLHPDEAAWIDAGPDRTARFLAVWVRKEAVVKLTGEGLQRDLRSFAVHPTAAGQEEVTGADDLGDVVTMGVPVPDGVAALAWRSAEVA